jgi:hypothetical protein
MTTISKPEQIYDVRLVDRHINSGKISRKDYEAYLRLLNDMADNVEIVPKDSLFDRSREEG